MPKLSQSKYNYSSFHSGVPFLISQLHTMYNKYKVGNVAYDLPHTDAAAAFKKIINPLKGKILIFWA